MRIGFLAKKKDKSAAKFAWVRYGQDGQGEAVSVAINPSNPRSEDSAVVEPLAYSLLVHGEGLLRAAEAGDELPDPIKLG